MQIRILLSSILYFIVMQSLFCQVEKSIAKENNFEKCRFILKTEKEADEMLKNGDYFDDNTLDYLPRIKFESYATNLTICLHDFENYFEELCRKNWSNSESKKEDKKNIKFNASRINSVFLSSTGISPVIQTAFWVRIEIKLDGSVGLVKIIDSKLDARNLISLDEITKEIKNTFWMPGLYKKQEVNSVLNYLITIE
ncbi:MAG: hypothetical protein MI974_21435 [Chitinophagales bacterium]|nr:hypothetical protein [Chitinophagales bacterium]